MQLNPMKIKHLLQWVLILTASCINWQTPELPNMNGIHCASFLFLAPGTDIDEIERGGWTHKVIHAVPRLESGAIASLPESGRRSATLIRTLILADVAKTNRGYELRRVGVGNSIVAGAHEKVVTANGPIDLRETLSPVERIVANVADAELRRGRVVVSTTTFALYRTPARLVVDGRQHEVDLYYALFVNAQTGELSTMNWSTARERVKAPESATRLPPNASFDCALDVEIATRVGPLALAWSFAMTRLPSGQPIKLSPDVREALTQSGSIEPTDFERRLRPGFGL